jgi:uncharacterized paraquat-inducible protein A
MSEITFVCPHCSQRIACGEIVNDWEIDCPGCGKTLFIPPPSEREERAESVPSLTKAKTAWLALAILFVPAVLTILGMLLGADPIVISIGGSLIAGISCGILLGISRKTVAERILFCILLVPIMVIVSFVLCFFSCALVMGRHITGG